jgi:hypothetical protein
MADQEPVLPPLTNRTIVKDHSSYGRSAVAAESIKCGEVVICEVSHAAAPHLQLAACTTLAAALLLLRCY